MRIPARVVQRLARRLNWSTDDALIAIKAVARETRGMSADAAASVVLVLNESITGMSPGMASVIVLAAEYRCSVPEARTEELQAV